MTYVRSLVFVSILALASSAAAQPSSAIVTEAIVNAPVPEVWAAWTTKAGVESWMTAKTAIDVQVGATWKTSYSPESTLDDEKAIHHTILAFDPERMLSFKTIRPPQGFPWPSLISQTWVVVYLEPRGDQTKVTVKMFGYTASDDSQKMRAFFERGNQITMDALVTRFSGKGQK
jgi:uncharacterized protein YndB with AHSA1/START domain